MGLRTGLDGVMVRKSRSDRPSHSASLYRLSYRSSCVIVYVYFFGVDCCDSVLRRRSLHFHNFVQVLVFTNPNTLVTLFVCVQLLCLAVRFDLHDFLRDVRAAMYCTAGYYRCCLILCHELAYSLSHSYRRLPVTFPC
jgi:hypothetical protein